MILFALLNASLLGATVAPDPLGPAAAGKMQCYSPDIGKKTCKSIASYRADGHNHFANTARLPIANEPPVALTTVTPVTVRDGAVCGTIAAADLEAGTIDVNGQALPKESAAPILTKIEAALAGTIGKEICTRYAPDGDALIAKVSVEGVARSDFDQRVIWISPADGYQVRQ